MSKTNISWTDETANWIVGCSKISQGCKNCYAATAANSARLQQFDQYKKVVDGNGNWNGNIEFVPKVLNDLLKGRRSRRVFAPSMSDPFHPGVKDEWLDQFFAVAALTPHITYQVLTKRPERMLEYMNETWQVSPDLEAFGVDSSTYRETRETQINRACEEIIDRHNLADTAKDDLWTEDGSLKIMQWEWPLRNLYLGVTAENQAEANYRIPYLLKLGDMGYITFVSIEPTIEEIDLVDSGMFNPGLGEGHTWLNPLAGVAYDSDGSISNTPAIDQIIIGGESGPNSRPFHLEWARSLIAQCQSTNTKVFMKQVGSNAFYQGKPFKTKSRAGSDPSEWPEWAQIQEFPNN